MIESPPTQKESPPSAGSSRDVLCPLCDYSLRGLTECRCPECGFTSTWDEMLDPRRARHPYLFEHHPENNVRSALRTFLGGLRPERFWSSLHPIQLSRPRRLIAYGLLCSAAYLTMFGLILTTTVLVQVQRITDGVLVQFSSLPQAQQAQEVLQFGSLQAVLRVRGAPSLLGAMQSVVTSPHTPFVILSFALVPVAWPWITFASLLVYQASMRRSRVKPVHLLRVSIYSYDLVAVAGLILLALPIVDSGSVMIVRPRGWWGAGWDLAFDATFIASLFIPIWTVLVLACSHRLWLACRRYLQFRLAWAAVIGSQLIVLLISCCIVFTTDLFFHHVPARVHMAMDHWLRLSSLLPGD